MPKSQLGALDEEQLQFLIEGLLDLTVHLVRMGKIESLWSRKPIMRALLLTLCLRLVKVLEVIRLKPTAKRQKELKSLTDEIWELSGWLAPMTPDNRDGTVEVLIELGSKLPYWFVKRLEKMGRSVGRPATKRHVLIQALELKQLNPRISWREIAFKLCDCGKEKHDGYCSESIRHGVIPLKKLLSKYEIAV